MGRWAWLLVGAALLAATSAPTAAGATTYPTLNAILTEIAQRPVQANCYSAEEWPSVAAGKGVDPTRTRGVVTFYSFDGGVTWFPEPYSHHAPGICERVEAFRVSPTRETQKTCQQGFDSVPRTEYRLEERVRYETRVKYVPSKRWVWVHKKGQGHKVLRPYRKRVEYRVAIVYTVQVPHTVYDQVPRIVICPDWGYKTEALHVMIHEGMHLAGVFDERAADCVAMRNLDWFAWKLGASPDFAREIQADEWVWYSQHPYFDSACVRD